MATRTSSPASNVARNDAAGLTPPAMNIPAPPQPAEHIELHFNDTNNGSVAFKLKSTTKFRKAMDAYSARVQRPVDQLRFLFEGERLKNEDTPASHEMVDGDIVEVHMEQIGGAGDASKHEEALGEWVDVNDSDAEKLEKLEKVTAGALKLAEARKEMERIKATDKRVRLNNHALAKENTDLKAEVYALQGEKDDLNREIQALQKSLAGARAYAAQLSSEKANWKNTLLQKNTTIDALVSEFSLKDHAIDAVLDSLK